MRIIFYGTPLFAVASLQKIVDHGFDVIAVVTSPDKPAGRGMQLQQSAVKQYALSQNLEVIQPVNLKSPEFMEQLNALKPELQVIIAFRMLPEIVWNFPPMGTINLHASLLPNYRGAAPINRAIMNGETTTGVTTFFLKHEIDTGNILLQKEVEILPEDDAGTLHDKLMDIGADLVVASLKKIKTGNLETKPQLMLATNTPAPKIFTVDCEIHWDQPIQKVHNQIRGLSPYPGAFTTYQDKILKIYKGYYLTDENVKPGNFEMDTNKQFRISAIDGWYYPTLVQPEGKRKMPVEDFVNGLRKIH
ncbi:MAG: methionyl-tRNA formyltransferase [Bacteroidia bacterium]